MFKGIFVDDRLEDQGIAENLSVPGGDGIGIEFFRADKEIGEVMAYIINFEPDVLALDYRLDEQQASVTARYKAGALAQYVRESVLDRPSNDLPIVLVSNEQNIDFFEHDKTSHDLFDKVWTKQRVVNETGDCRRELLALVEGYKAIISFWNHEQRLNQVLGADEAAAYLLNNQEMRKWNTLHAPHLLAKQILRFVIDRTGLLVDKNNLLSILGIAPNSPQCSELLSIVSREAIYRGAFANGWQRWWSHRVSAFGQTVCGTDPGNLTAEQRTEYLRGVFKLNLHPAKSTWTDRSDFFPAFACASCEQPTDRLHSVAIYDDAPSFLMKRRICWQCISTGEFERLADVQIADTDEGTVQKLKKGLSKGS